MGKIGVKPPVEDSRIKAVVPLPIQIVIDDVGWWSGEDGSARQEPYRTGISRRHVPADYEAIVSLGRQLNMRPQAAFILCEWDRKNILRDLPSSTWMGEAWDNRKWTGPWQDAAAEIIRNGRRHLEVTLHGIGHEYWTTLPDGTRRFTRAEWHDADGNMRPRVEVLKRLDYFQRILDQHRLGDFPTSFVPCAFMHRFADREGDLAALLGSAGVRFISTRFQTMQGAELVKHRWFDFDQGVMTVDRGGGDLLDWFAIGTAPEGEIAGPICGMHWPSILHENPARNEEIVGAWVRLLRAHDRRLDRMLARDTTFFAGQLAHHTCVRCEATPGGINLDFAEMAKLPHGAIADEFALKVQSPVPLVFESAQLEMVESTFREEAGETLHTIFFRRGAVCGQARVEWRARG